MTFPRHASSLLAALPFVWTAPSSPAAGRDWITETPHAFLASGRFFPASAGRDLAVVDKASGLARLGRFVEGDLQWSEQALGLASLTGFATLREGGDRMDLLAATAPSWNAVQTVVPGGTPRTLPPPVVGAHALVRLSTGHEAGAGAVVEDLLGFSRWGGETGGEGVGAANESGQSLFVQDLVGVPDQAQFIPLAPADGRPVLVGLRQGHLRVDLVGRQGMEPGGFVISGPHVAGLLWAVAGDEVFAVEPGGVQLEHHRIASSPGPGGISIPVGASLAGQYPLPEPVIGLDAVPFVDPARPTSRHVAAVRFVSSPSVVRLLRLHSNPDSTEELAALEVGPDEAFAGLVALEDRFLLFGGPDGRIAGWQEFAQPGPGLPPSQVAAGRLPPLPARSGHPNLFYFDLDPFLAADARYVGSLGVFDWSTATPTGVVGETDRGASDGLGAIGSVAPFPLGPVVLGNQLLPAASVGSFGPVSAPVRDAVQFQPPSGVYSLPASGAPFRITLRGPGPEHAVRARWSGNDAWRDLDANPSAQLSGNATLLAYAVHRATGATTPIFSATYSFDAPPPLAPASATDGDGDGLSDAWQRLFGVADPRSDADGDGADALAEHRAGTDPFDPASRPGIVEPTLPALVFEGVRDGRIQLRWPPEASGWTLEVSGDLAGWSLADPPAAGNAWSEPLAAGHRFYRLRRP